MNSKLDHSTRNEMTLSMYIEDTNLSALNQRLQKYQNSTYDQKIEIISEI
jgi:hypothetical protein